MNKIQSLDATTGDIIAALCEGNPGALSVLMMWIRDGAEIDPDAGPFATIHMLMLDDLRIYGSRIWVLYKDVCGSSLRRFLAVLRAYQLGFLSRHELIAASQSGRLNDVDALIAKVEERLPRFQRAPIEA